MLYLEKLNSFIENKYVVSNWKKKKFVWRYSFFFSIFYILLVFGIVYTLIVRILISREKFSNHSCSSSRIMSVQSRYMEVLIFIILMGFINFFFSRLTYLYSNFTNSEFFNLGIYYTVVGFLIKYISWILSLIYMSWLFFLIINIITIFSSPNKWCSLKYNIYGMDALNNCLLVKNRATVIVLRKKESCNDFNILKVQSFLFLVRSSPNLVCSLKDKKLCDFFVDFIKNKQTSWESFPNCSGNTVDLREQYFLEDSDHKSNIYLFSISFILFWLVTTIILLTFIIVIKVNTPIDSSFIMNEERLNLFFKFTRLLDVWR
ncbi:conserved Plasmodium protein, unknown function [Plasmodium gallinaceum]|uniref:Uncharacterized protein n=1 Tax=Plasmodium gallinaceum TaxID=5849 RepID=A0A1J1GZJ8_PLAGA|nr:conserved Plasmodium protein, unknown function [Plasmodium gallinaceum]CRG96721.1 conserved Plasmodium protein, unknown function [Plasmodium gallinaceum]